MSMLHSTLETNVRKQHHHNHVWVCLKESSSASCVRVHATQGIASVVTQMCACVTYSHTEYCGDIPRMSSLENARIHHTVKHVEIA